MKQAEIDNIQHEISELNLSGLSFVEFFNLKNVNEQLNSSLLMFFEANNFLINKKEVKYSEYYSVFLKSHIININIVLFKEAGSYHLSLYDSKFVFDLFSGSKRSIFRNHKLSYLETLFSKNPSLLKFFKSLHFEDLSPKRMEESVEKISFVLSVLKNTPFNNALYSNLKDEYNNTFLSNTLFQYFLIFKNDHPKNNSVIHMLSHLIKRYNMLCLDAVHTFKIFDFLYENLKTNQFLNKKISNKSLLTQEMYDLFFSLRHNEIFIKDFLNNIIPNISGFKTSQQLASSLLTLCDTQNNWKTELLTKKLVANNVPFFSPIDGVLVARIYNREHSILFGSPAWCINKDTTTFNELVSQKLKQHIIFDLNRNSIDPDSIIGISIDHKHRVPLREAFNKSNDCVVFEKRNSEIMIKSLAGIYSFKTKESIKRNTYSVLSFFRRFFRYIY